MSVIRLQFVLGAGISSRLISWWGTGYGGFSHVDAVLSDGNLLGARSDEAGDKPKGVQIRPPFYESWKKRMVVEIDSTGAQAQAWEGWLRKQVGKQYDQDAILGFIIGRRLHKDGHFICSACQHTALERSWLVGHSPWPSSEVTPNSLAYMVTAGLKGRITTRVGL